MQAIYINGRFLSQKVTGVQRYASELVTAIDQHLRNGDAPPSLLASQWVLQHPPGVTTDLGLSVIKQQPVGTRSGHLWEQTQLAFAARQGILVSLANSGPIAHGKQLAVLHDAQIYRLPENFSRSYRTLHKVIDRGLAFSASIGTVSKFSRSELSSVLGLPEGKMFVVPNGADHIDRIAPDQQVLERLQLHAGRYFLFVGSSNKNKNLDAVLAAHEDPAFSDHPVVVVGGANAGVFGTAERRSRTTVIDAGRVSDAELAALYANATAFVFPSLYEGFGIPPLEAMRWSCPVIASTARAVVEVCGDAAVYFDPRDPVALRTAMAERIARGPLSAAERQAQLARLDLYTWSNAARSLIGVIAGTVEERR